MASAVPSPPRRAASLALWRGWTRNHPWATLWLVGIAARAIAFGDPVVHVDEEFYFAAAHAMGRGAVPFVDVWDRKPIGLFLLYLPAAALPLPWGTLAYQAMATAALVATAGLVGRLAAMAGWRRGALPAGIAYLLWPDLLGGVGGQAPILYNLPMAGAAWLIVAAAGGRARRRLGLAAMTLVGVALQIKYSAVFEGVFFGLWLSWQEWRATRRLSAVIGHGAALVAVALAPTAAALAAYAAIGQAPAFIYANFLSIAHRQPDPLSETLGNVGTLMLILSPLVTMAALARGAPAVDGDARARTFLFGWLAAALVGLALFRPWFDHYGLPVLVPGSACAAGFLGGSGTRRRIGSALLALVAVGGQVTALVNIHNRGNAAQFAALARAVGRGPGCLYVYSGSTMLYVASGRCRVSRFVVPAHLTRTRENGATGIDQATELRRILAARPAVIVMRPPFRGERPDIRRIAIDAVTRGYRLAATLPMGSEAIAVYKRRSGAL